MTVMCFGIARDISGGDQIDLSTESPSTVRELRSLLESMYPRLSTIKSYMVAVDLSYADDDQQISQSSEIAIIPPVSGG